MTAFNWTQGLSACCKVSLLVLALGLSASCKKANQPSSSETGAIFIGEVQTLTGSEATFGVSIHRGIELAIRQVNQSGGIQGRNLEMITLDDQGKSEEAATAATKLITQSRVLAVLGALASSRSLAMAPILQKSHIPMITPTATNPQVTETGDSIFRVCFTDPFQGGVMAKFALNVLKVKKVAVVRDIKSDYSMGLASFFSSTFKEGGGEIVAQQSYTSGDIDFKSQLTAIRVQKPQAIFIPGYYTEVGLIARQARELGITAPLLGGDGWSSPKLREIAGRSIENSYYSNHYSETDPSDKIQKFIKDFKAAYGLIPDGIAALGYDSARFLIDAIQRSKTPTPSEIRDALAETHDFVGVTGKITLDKNRNPIKSATILTIHDGEPVFHSISNPD